METREAFLREYKNASKQISLPASEVFLSRLLLESGKANDAVAMLEAYLSTKPDDLEAYIALGFVASQNGRWTDVWLQLQQAHCLIEEGKLPATSIVATAGWIRLKQGALAEADRILTQLAARGPIAPQSAYYIGNVIGKERQNGRCQICLLDRHWIDRPVSPTERACGVSRNQSFEVRKATPLTSV